MSKSTEQRNNQGAVGDSPIAEIFQNRRPEESERRWAESTLANTLDRTPEKPIGAASGVNLDESGHAQFTTISGVPVRRLYTQADLPEDWNYEKYLGYPGQAPYTRGIHSSGYRGRLWTMRQFSGFASPEETNERDK
jgi:methylmalonyl-CoA mutase N-terminal domain/subunit